MTDDIDTLPIADLAISRRAFHCLSFDDVKTVGDLALLTEAELLRIPNFGRRSLQDVKAALATLGVSLAEDPPPVDARPGLVAKRLKLKAEAELMRQRASWCEAQAERLSQMLGYDD